ncbi:MAG: hypothetical protein IKN52_14000, partial [Victivallales bacterium]|nr:hypothetical protein [Victivallales bacterium]
PLPGNKSGQGEYHQKPKRLFHSHAFHFRVFDFPTTLIYYTIYIKNHKSPAPHFRQFPHGGRAAAVSPANTGHGMQKVDNFSI